LSLEDVIDGEGVAVCLEVLGANVGVECVAVDHAAYLGEFKDFEGQDESGK